MTDIDVTAADRRTPVAMYLYAGPNDEHKPLDAEGLHWLADQLCSAERVHPDRTMASGWIPSQAAFELPHLVDTTAQQAAEIAELRAEVERLRCERDNAIQQAQGWKMEAMSHKSTVHQAYQHITGATGEPGNWNGANPIIAALAREGEG